MGRPLQHEPDREAAQRARANLEHAGVRVELSPGSCATSHKLKQLEDGPTAMKREEYEDAGGPGTGGTWSAAPDGTPMPNAHWRAATQARVGCINIPQDTTCRLKANGCSSCEATIDQSGIHSQLCKLAPARMRPHRGVQTTLGGPLRNTGAHADLERESPDLFTWQGQKYTATLDAAIRWLMSLHTTVRWCYRCPHASRYGGAVTASPTEAAEDEKHKRYADPGVTPIAFSTSGRLVFGRRGERNTVEALLLVSIHLPIMSTVADFTSTGRQTATGNSNSSSRNHNQYHKQNHHQNHHHQPQPQPQPEQPPPQAQSP